jgi:hypothetical protein
MKKSAIVIFAILCTICGFAVDATYVQSEVSIPYTPSTAVAAGDVLVLSNNIVAVANRAIAADALGSISLRGVYKMAHVAGTTYIGQNVYWDEDGDQYGNDTTGTGCITTSASGNNWCGWAIEAATATDSTVKVMLYPLGNVDSTTLTVSGSGTIGGTLAVTGVLTPAGGLGGATVAVTNNATVAGTLAVTGAITGSSTVAATGYKIGAVSGTTGIQTNSGTGYTNLWMFSGGLLTNVSFTGTMP